MVTAVQQLNSDFFGQSFEPFVQGQPPLALSNLATAIDFNNPNDGILSIVTPWALTGLAATTGGGGAGGVISITGGAGDGAGAGGALNLTGGASASGAPGEVQVNGVSGLFETIWFQPLSTTAAPASAAVVTFFMANRAYRVKAVSVIEATHGTSETFTFTKDTGTAAPGSGTAILTGAIAVTVNNTRVVGVLSATLATITLAAGDRLAFTVGGTVGSAAGVTVAVLLEPV